MEINHKRIAEQLDAISQAFMALAGSFRTSDSGGGAAEDDAKPARRTRGAAKSKPAAAGKAETPEITEDSLRAALKELAATKGKDAMAEALAEVGAGRLPDVDESDYATLDAKIKELMEAEAEEDDEEEAPPSKAKRGRTAKAKKPAAPTMEELTEKFQELVDADRKAARALLKDAGLAKLSEIDTDDDAAMQEMMAAVVAALEGDEDEDALV